MPPNITAFIKKLIPIVMFDFLGKFWKWREHPDFIRFDFEGLDQISEDIKDSAKDLGYETSNCLINLTTIVLIIFFY